jgi:hypothetical protein
VTAIKVVKLIIVSAAMLTPITGHADTEAPAGLGQAGDWIKPCTLLDRQVKGETLGPVENNSAALCQGAFTGIMVVLGSSQLFRHFMPTRSIV